MDRNIDQTGEQVNSLHGTSRSAILRYAYDTKAAANKGQKRGRGVGMSRGHLLASVALLGVIVAGLAGLGGAKESVRAGTAAPIITSTEISLDPFSVDASGTGFTPGGKVHIDLV